MSASRAKANLSRRRGLLAHSSHHSLESALGNPSEFLRAAGELTIYADVGEAHGQNLFRIGRGFWQPAAMQQFN